MFLVHGAECVWLVTDLAVTTCNNATKALAMLRENRSYFDLVITDVYMPDMDGFKLLEAIGLELDLPVISMFIFLMSTHLVMLEFPW